MMSHPDAGSRLRELLAERLERVFEDHDDALSWLEGLTDAERAAALIAGEGAQLDADELEPICATLALDAELFSCIVNPTSLEVRRHSLEEVAFRLDAEEDEDDEAISAFLTRLETLDELDEAGVDELILDIAAYLDVYEDEDEVVLSEFLSAEEMILIRTMRTLPGRARSRVVEFANAEMVDADAPDHPIASVWHDAGERVQRILLAVANTPRRELTEGDLCDLLGFEPNEVAALEQGLMRACARHLEHSPDDLDELPLARGFRSGQIIYSMPAGTAAVVRALGEIPPREPAGG